MPEYVLVEFEEDDRVVLVDGHPSGYTNIIFDTETGPHRFALEGAKNCMPRSRKRVVKRTSPDAPLVLRFEKVDK